MIYKLWITFKKPFVDAFEAIKDSLSRSIDAFREGFESTICGYDEESLCVKCGHKGLTPSKYVRFLDVLRKTCPDCGAHWLERPYDWSWRH